MEKLTKKIKEEEHKFEQEIEETLDNYAREINELCEEEILHLKDECMCFQKEIHKKAEELDRDLITIKKIKNSSVRVGKVNYQ